MNEPTTFSGVIAMPEFTGAYLFLTNRCNLSCRYCYVPQEPPADMAPRVVRWAADFLIKHSRAEKRLGLVLFGGEPLLVRDRVWEALDYATARARQYGKSVGSTLVTNGLLLTPHLLQQAVDRGCLIHISCDGPEDTGRCDQNGQPSFPALQARLEPLAPMLGRCRDHLLMRVTIGRHNLDLVRVVSTAMDLGFRRIQLNTVSGCGPLALDEITAHSLCSSLHALVRWYLGRVAAGQAVPEIPILDDVLRVQGKERDEPYQPGCCRAGRSQLAVGEDGSLYFCNGWYRDARFKIGRLPEGVTSGAFEWFGAAEKRVCRVCDRCPYRWSCPTLCWKENLERTGDAGLPDPVNCTIAKAYFDAATEIQKATGATTFELSQNRGCAARGGRLPC
jgi:uncharacterized protein